MQSPHAVLFDPGRNRWLSFSAPETVFEVSEVTGVLPALEAADRLVKDRRLWAVGFMAYEAAPAFDPAMHTHPPGAQPLLWLGLFPGPETVPAPPEADESISGWTPDVPREGYLAAIREIKEQIALGNTYQVNFTMQLRAPFAGHPWSLFCALVGRQPSRHSTYIHTGRHAICSASPELFFELDGKRLTSRPMKGTAARGLSAEEDLSQAAWLQGSEKNRAENLMIVDMVRNDMGRIAETGSVQVPQLFEVERYPTVLQMTSTVTCRTSAPVPEIFRALFPCASITGAPKIRTMEVIRSLERGPRGVYTGAIGFWGPGRRARFNVAIRTISLDLQARQARYGTGGGIVWDSGGEEEYEECLLKAGVLSAAGRPAFELLESIYWMHAGGFALLDRHLERLCASALYFNVPLERQTVMEALEQAARGWDARPRKVRLMVDSAGQCRVEDTVIAGSGPGVFPPSGVPSIRATIAAAPVDPGDVFLYHKTTHRRVYEEALSQSPGFDTVLLWNARGEATEFTAANLVIRLGARYVTPPVACGLLPGTLRAELLAQGLVEEQVVRLADLAAADEIWAVNSVRGWQRVKIEGLPELAPPSIGPSQRS